MFVSYYLMYVQHLFIKSYPHGLFVQGLLFNFKDNSIVFCFVFKTIVDLYSGLIVKFLEQNLYVKSWGIMRRPLPSTCTPEGHHVNNVVEVKLPKRKFFKSTVDHSKWCVTPDGNWTCIADMNREKSQMERAGGAICTENVAVAKAFTNIVRSYEPCKRARSNNDAHSHEL